MIVGNWEPSTIFPWSWYWYFEFSISFLYVFWGMQFVSISSNLLLLIFLLISSFLLARWVGLYIMFRFWINVTFNVYFGIFCWNFLCLLFPSCFCSHLLPLSVSEFLNDHLLWKNFWRKVVLEDQYAVFYIWLTCKLINSYLSS